MRSDAVGIFWEDHQTKTGRGNVTRIKPPVPETGWHPPAEYPDLSAAKMISIDLETRDVGLDEGLGPGPKREGSFIAGLAVGVDTGERWYFPIAHEMGGNLPAEHVLRWAKANLCNARQPKLGAKLIYDLDFLAQAGVHVKGEFNDVQVAEPLLDELQLTYNLDDISLRRGGRGKVGDEEMYLWCSRAFGGKPTREGQAKNIWRAPVQLAGPYAEGDVDLPFQIFHQQRRELEEQNLWGIYEIERDLIPMLVAMRQRGVRVDCAAAEEFHKEASVELKKLQAKVEGINVNSGEDIAKLCDRHGIDYPRTEIRINKRGEEAGGNPSFVKNWLSNHPHPLMRGVTEVRSLMKLRDTFVNGYILQKNILGRIYAEFNQLKSDDYGAVSGRLSSSNPNLQNIPKRTKLGKLIRQMFLADEGEDWDRLDWSQIEYRLLAHYAIGIGAEATRERYRRDPSTDFHEMVCEMVNRYVHIDRDHAKNINFGLVYGMGVPLLSGILGLTEEAGQELLNGYHEAVPFVKRTYNAASNRAREMHRIKTLLGRLRRFPNGLHTHKALNALLQGSAADVMKKAMVLIWQYGLCDILGAPLLTCHDELAFSVPRTKIAHEAMREVRHIMENVVQLKVPLMAEHERGTNWGNCKKDFIDLAMAA